MQTALVPVDYPLKNSLNNASIMDAELRSVHGALLTNECSIKSCKALELDLHLLQAGEWRAVQLQLPYRMRHSQLKENPKNHKKRKVEQLNYSKKQYNLHYASSIYLWDSKNMLKKKKE